MSHEFLAFVIVDVEAGLETETLKGLVDNLTPEIDGPFGPAAIWQIRHGSDYAIELRLRDAGNIVDVQSLLIDKIRTVRGITETQIRPIFDYRWIDDKGSQRAFEAARSDSAELLGVVLCDVTPGQDRAVHEKLLALKEWRGVTPVEVEMAFHSVDFDLSVLVVGRTERQFYDYILEKIRPIDGIHDTLCEIWEIAHVFGKDEDFVAGWTSMACM